MSLILDERARLFFEYFGVIVLGWSILKLLRRFLNNIGTFFVGTGAVNFKKYGSWAVVTGCTDGIGKAYAEKLAKRGVNIVLISRTLEKLEQQAKELKDTYKVDTLVIAADFTEQESIYEPIKKKLSDLDIGVLVNNVGMSYAYPEYFDVFGETDKAITNLINCNITSLTQMTAIVLPNMVKNRRGIIINNASASGRVPTPFLTVYSASKAYVDFFSRALEIEYRNKGIIVQSLCPYFVSTKLSQVKSSFWSPKPNPYVDSALNTLATQSVTNGCLAHNLQGFFIEDILPRALVDHLTCSTLLGARARALRKIQRKQQEEQEQKKASPTKKE